MPKASQRRFAIRVYSNRWVNGFYAFIKRLFYSRVNRSGFILGHIFITFASLTVVRIVTYLLSYLIGYNIAMFILVSFFTLIYIYYTTSLFVRRLHDINMPSLLVLGAAPSFIYSLIADAIFRFSNLTDIRMFSIPEMPSFINQIFILSYCYGLLLFFYLLFWSGSKKENKYGSPATQWSIKSLLGVTSSKNTGIFAGTKTLLNVISMLLILAVLRLILLLVTTFM